MLPIRTKAAYVAHRQLSYKRISVFQHGKWKYMMCSFFLSSLFILFLLVKTHSNPGLNTQWHPIVHKRQYFCFVNSFSSLSGPGNDGNVMSSLQSMSREWNAFDPRSPVIENKVNWSWSEIVSYSIMLEKLCGNLRNEVTTKRTTFFFSSSTV